MDYTVCQYKKEKIRNQQNRIDREKNSLEYDYQNCNGQFQYGKARIGVIRNLIKLNPSYSWSLFLFVQ